MISMIWAEDEQHGIGKQQTIPWNIPDDMEFFKQTTMHQSVIMGRNTFDSIGRPLPKRQNIVLTHNPAGLPSGVTGVTTLEAIYELIKVDPQVTYYVMGGAYLYRQMLPMAEELLITRVYGKFDCDVFAPEVDLTEFKLQKIKFVPSINGVPAHAFECWQK